MTGAQERSLERLTGRKENFRILSQPRDGEIRVQWQRRNAWGGFTTVKAAIHPSGRVVEVP